MPQNASGKNAFDNAGRAQELGPNKVRWQGDLEVTGIITSSGSGGEELANNTWLQWLNAAGSAALNILKADASNNTILNALTGKKTSFEVNAAEIAKVDANGVTGTAFNLTDGSDKNHNLSTFASGTGYSFTNASAAIAFGTSTPSLVLDKAGTYLILANLNIEYVGATFASARVLTLKLRRTNNTPADLTGPSSVLTTDIVTTKTFTFANVNLPPVFYTTTNTNDIVVFYGGLDTAPTAGSLQAVAGNIVAVRLF